MKKLVAMLPHAMLSFFLYLMKFDIEFMIIKPLRRTHVRIGNG